MIQRFDVGPRMSEMAVHQGTIYLAGQVAEDASADIAGQTAQVLAAIDALLLRAGVISRNHRTTTILATGAEALTLLDKAVQA